MIKYQKYGYIVILLFILLLSTAANASLLEPYVILQAEHGDLVGQNLFMEGNSELSYVTVMQGYQNDELSLIVDIFNDERYEFWVRLKGRSSGAISLSSSNSEIYREIFQGTGGNWHWINLKKTCKIEEGRYNMVLSDFTGSVEIDQVIVKTIAKGKKPNDMKPNQSGLYSIQSTTASTTSTTSTVPVLPTGSPWVKQGLNPFASLLQNGNEFVSTTSGVLSIVATDLVIPGRGGMDLVFSRHYNSKTHENDEIDDTYLYGRWDFGFPHMVKNIIYFPNGSECNIYDDEV
ncbi:MAG: hypothetical protein KAX49_09505 [Halanaerobiales bacterium]|nr:hypothetical protein [Halanaerobiales bacterium]